MMNGSLGHFDTPEWMGEIRAWPGCQEVLPRRSEAKVKAIGRSTAKHQAPSLLGGVSWPAEARERAEDPCLVLRDKPETDRWHGKGGRRPRRRPQIAEAGGARVGSGRQDCFCQREGCVCHRPVGLLASKGGNLFRAETPQRTGLADQLQLYAFKTIFSMVCVRTQEGPLASHIKCTCQARNTAFTDTLQAPSTPEEDEQEGVSRISPPECHPSTLHPLPIALLSLRPWPRLLALPL